MKVKTPLHRLGRRARQNHPEYIKAEAVVSADPEIAMTGPFAFVLNALVAAMGPKQRHLPTLKGTTPRPWLYRHGFKR
tara:strand:- start:3966 stop:4199 length:234 start_codon:yes stop_codon:yes gene_type:complete